MKAPLTEIETQQAMNILLRKQVLAKSGELNNYVNLGLSKLKEIEMIFKDQPAAKEDLCHIVDLGKELVQKWRIFRNKHGV